MEQLIFIAVIIAISLIESIAKSRKRKAGGQETPGPEWEWEPEQQPVPAEDSRSTVRSAEAGAERGQELPTYDQDPTYDEALLYDEGPSRVATGQGAKARKAGGTESSEGMIPADIWEEIAGLARRHAEPAKPAPRPAPPPPPSPPARRTERSTSVPVRREARGRGAPSIHLAHAEYGTDPSTRSPSREGLLDAPRRTHGRVASVVRRELRGSPDALRRAVILQEVLGPPAALRQERFDWSD